MISKEMRRVLVAWFAITALMLLAGCAHADPIEAAAQETIAQDTAARETSASEQSLSVVLGGREYSVGTRDITVYDAEITELRAALEVLPSLAVVRLEGSLPADTELTALRRDYPGITFHWNFTVYGVETNTLSESLDLSGIALNDTDELEAKLPWFYNLHTVDMVGCGISDEDMDALNTCWPDTRFVWEIRIYTARVRTDITYFMPYKFHLSYWACTDFSNLRYCKDLVAIDLGHFFRVEDISFLRDLPKLEFLILGDCAVSDLTPLGSCTQLKYLELFKNPLVDLWPLTNLTNLEDVNLGFTPDSTKVSDGDPEMWDIAPLLQMTWLERLYVQGTSMEESDRELLQESLADTNVVFNSPGFVSGDWRYGANYYIMRDLVEMGYMY